MQMVFAEVKRQHGIDISSDMRPWLNYERGRRRPSMICHPRNHDNQPECNGRKIRAELSRETFTAAIQPFLEGMKFTLRTVLNDSGLTTNEIADVLLVGGSTRVPAVRQVVRDFFVAKTQYHNPS